MASFDLNILVVDDSPIIARNLSAALRGLFYNVVKTAANGKEAIDAYRTCKPDLVTMDITMPVMDGIEATRHIMREFPNAKIIMVTSHGQEKMVLDALKAGAKGYVLKPFQAHKLYQAIQKALNRTVQPEKLEAEIAQRAAQREAENKLEAAKAAEQASAAAVPEQPAPGADQSTA